MGVKLLADSTKKDGETVPETSTMQRTIVDRLEKQIRRGRSSINPVGLIRNVATEKASIFFFKMGYIPNEKPDIKIFLP